MADNMLRERMNMAQPAATPQGSNALRSLLGFLSDSQSWQDMGRNALNMIGSPLPTKQEAMANALRRRLQGSVMRDYPGAETDAANAYREKMTNLALGMNPVLMMAGPKAKTANLAALEQAQKLEQSGAPREAIWNQTGWFKGPEGKWKFEIDDSGARFNATKRNGQMVEEDISRGTPGLDYGPTVGGLLRHDLLQSAYPDPLTKRTFLGNKNTMFGDGVHGAYDNGTLTINTPVKAQDGRSTALHELQHAIQDREGFASGGNPGMMGLEKIKAHNEWEALSDALQIRKELDAGRPLTAVLDDYRKAGLDWNDRALQLANEIKTPELEKLTNKAFQEFGKYGDLKRVSEVDLYKRLAGEAESRAVQARMNMTPAQRQATPPWLSYDVPWDQLIVR